MSEIPDFNPVPEVARQLELPQPSVAAVVRLLDDKATVPFIARYRKEATGNLDEVQIRAVQERRDYLQELEQRRQAILAEIAGQGKLTDELRAQILACTAKSALEDLYRPFKPKRRTRASMARERGLEPLALRILEQPQGADPLAEAAAFVDPEKEVPDAGAALAGARDIVAEQVADNAEVRGYLRRLLAAEADLSATRHPKLGDARTKFEQYYDFRERACGIPSHRFLALLRGERDKALRVQLELDPDRPLARIERMLGLQPASPFSGSLRQAVADAYARLLFPSLENDIRNHLKQRSDEAAVAVFASNLKNLLLAPPLGSQPVVGIDPGLRTGCKCAALDGTGRFLESLTIHLAKGEAAEQRGRQDLLGLLRKHQPAAVAVGNGTGGRETEAFVRKLVAEEQLQQVVVQVNEAGASVYSASDLAREELPDLDVTVRGAVSIARRLQDPLAELVKIEPRAIGVGQYQHDVHQPLLNRKLDEVVESCVNRVGVELQTASAPLLARVAGVGPRLAKKIVAHRERQGAFASRRALLEVPGLGPRTFEQAAGFLRVRDSDNPLDASAVHPERYELVRRMAADLGLELSRLVGNEEAVARIETGRYVGGDVGQPTLQDIRAELLKPGRDPRARFEAPTFREDVTSIEDLREGMVLQGVVSNVTAFGAFVDVGVHQDGLVHISELADRFVRDPHEVVQVGERLMVRVLGVDLERRRISLSARQEGQRPPRPRPPRREGKQRGNRPGQGGGGRPGGGQPQKPGFSHNPFADLLKKK
jgi:uncharacterized protein